jgi:hypothetical protein
MATRAALILLHVGAIFGGVAAGLWFYALVGGR